jgi:hypothetical protein
VVDAPPGDVGDVQQAIDAAEVHERTVIGDVLDHAFQHLAFFEALDQIGALLGAGLFEYRAARNNDVAAALIHFQNLEGLRAFHQRADIAHRADIHLAAWQEGDGAVQIDGVATFHLIEDAAFDLLIGFKGLFEADPGMLAACLLARQHGLAKRIFNALKIDFNGLANLELAIGGHGTEFAHRDAPFGFQADIDDNDIFFEGQDGPVDHGAFFEALGFEASFEHSREIVAARVHAGIGNIGIGHVKLCS